MISLIPQINRKGKTATEDKMSLNLAMPSCFCTEHREGDWLSAMFCEMKKELRDVGQKDRPRAPDMKVCRSV